MDRKVAPAMRFFVWICLIVTLPALRPDFAQSTPPCCKQTESDKAAKQRGETGGVEILSDTQGVDFKPWLRRWHEETERSWNPLIPDEVNPPTLKSGMVVIRFTVLPNGRLKDQSIVLEGRSGDPALDRAAWLALTGSDYPPLPAEFHGPFLEVRAHFLYNMKRPR
jgi:TonB family protein